MKALLVAAVVLGLAAVGPVPAQADPLGTIEGTVANGTEGGGSVADLEVTLAAWQQGKAVGEPVTTRTNSMGAFGFDGVSTSADYTYTVSVRYQGVDYSADAIQVSAETSVARLEIAVFEPTTSPEAIRVLLDHLAVKVDGEGGRLAVMNYLKIANTGDRTYVGDRTTDPNASAPTLRLSLPREAASLELLQGLQPENLVMQDDTLAENRPVPPGEQDLAFTYELAYSSGSYIFQRALDYPTDKVTFLVPAEGVQIESEQLPTRQEAETAGGKYVVASGEGLSAGTPLEVVLTGLPQGGGGPLSLGNILRPAVVMLVVLALTAAVAYPRFRRRPAAAPVEQRDADEEARERRKAA
ncbi:MAG: hypothetical protein Q8P22_02590 [Chloroflexota bacterium]|nr:hypothetical protein [Chloroflexota bacterium]